MALFSKWAKERLIIDEVLAQALEKMEIHLPIQVIK